MDFSNSSANFILALGLSSAIRLIICSNSFSKGNKVYVEGRLQTRKWQDQNGNDRYTTEIVSNVLKNLTPKEGEGGGGFGGEPPLPNENSMGSTNDGGTGDDVPF